MAKAQSFSVRGPRASVGLVLLIGVTACAVEAGPTDSDVVSSAQDPLQAFGWRFVLQERVRKLAYQHGMYERIPPAPDVSDELFELGRLLAFDKILSGNRDIACMTCHHPTLGTGDGRSLSIGTGGTGLGPDRDHPDNVRIPRNAPALFNLHAFPTMFWDSRVAKDGDGVFLTPAGDQLDASMQATLQFGLAAAQALFPVTSRDEMRGHAGENELADVADDDWQGIWTALMARLGEIDEYVSLFESAYPGESFEDMTFAHAANAIGAFEVRAFEATQSPWERFLAGDDRALSTSELWGAHRFFKVGCVNCHSGPLLSDFSHRNSGLAQFGPGKGHGPNGNDDFGGFAISGTPGDLYAFRVPSLVNVELTAPYGHVGQFRSLARHVRHYRNPRFDLLTYQVERETDDPALTGTQVPTQQDVLSGLDPDVLDLQFKWSTPLVRFLRTLTDPASVDPPGVVPDEVPSGLPVD